MANVDGHNSSPSGGSFSVETATKRVSLTHWIHRVIGLSQAQIKMRLRGNVLHLLCEGQPCPDAEAIVWRLQRAFAIAPLEKLLPAGSPQIFQMTIYGRELGEANPAWTRTIHFHCSSLLAEPIDPSSESTVTRPPATSEAVTESIAGETLAENTSATIAPELITSEAIAPTSAEPGVSEPVIAESLASEPSVSESANLEEAVVLSPVLQESQVDTDSDREAAAIVHIADLARQGQPDAIAWYLSEVLSHLDVAVRVKIEVGKPASENAGEPNSQTTESTSPVEPPKRLLILCESIYAPDPGRLAEPIAQRLRELELSGFQHAIVFGQVQGEIRPEWLLRVDLTPPEITLREWARWGDVQAISQLLNQNLRSQEIQVSALLKDSTLHLSCSGMGVTAPDKLMTLSTIAPLLQELAPQGIHAATIYGLIRDPANTVATAEDDETVVSPLWVHWLDLPATTTQLDRALSTLELAQQGNLEAITFLLTRLLNPDLATKLATGGIRVQIRQKGDLLHVMTDAPNCPRQSDVGAAVVRFLKPLAIADVVGVRVYGRRAGQKQPLWSYGADFAPRSRLVPEATPEFAASDAYVNELLSSPGAIVLWSELPPNAWRSVIQAACGTAVGWLQRSLIASQLFVPWESVTLNASTTEANLGSETGSAARSAYGVGVALIWSTVGVLLVLQSDWLLGGWVQPLLTEQLAPISQRPATPAPAASPAPLPNLPLQKSQPAASEDFNESGFTRPGSVVVSPQTPTETGQPSVAEVALLASPLQPTAESVSAVETSAYPTFNSRQFDTQLTLYRRFLEQHGTPDVLVIGSSRALRGIDPVALQTALAEQGYPSVKVFNFGVNGATVQVVDLLVRQILPPERLPKLILWADGARAFNSGRIDITYNGIVASEGYRTLVAGQPPIPGTTVAQAAGTETKPQADPDKAGTEEVTASLSGSYRVLNDWLNQRLAALSVTYGQRDRLKTRLREQVSAWLPQSGTLAASMRLISPNSLADSTSPAASASTSAPPVLAESQSQIDVNGFLPLAVRFNPATYYQKYPRVPGDYDSDYESFQLNGKQTDALIALAQFAQAQNIPLVFVNLPLTAEYLDPPRQRHEDEFQRHMLQLAPQLGLIYRDLSQSFGNRSDYFSDPSHLNRYGGYEVSRRLAQDVMIPWSQAR